MGCTMALGLLTDRVTDSSVSIDNFKAILCNTLMSRVLCMETGDLIPNDSQVVRNEKSGQEKVGKQTCYK